MPRHDPITSRPPPAAPRSPAPLANAHAWARYRRVMRAMTVLALVCAIVALAWLWWASGGLHLHMAIAAFAGVFLTVLVGTGLMSLAFLSSGTGHDAAAGERFERD